MQLGWKVLVPFSLVWLLAGRPRSRTVRSTRRPTCDSWLVWVGIALAVLLLIVFEHLADERELPVEEHDEPRRTAPFAGAGRCRPRRPAVRRDLAVAPAALPDRGAGGRHPGPATIGRRATPRTTGRRRSTCLDPVKGFGVTFATMFKKSRRPSYPEAGTPTAPRYHGRHVLNRHPDGLEKCVGCELCAWACPADAIYVEGGDNTDERALLTRRALRRDLPDQLPALHLLRAVHRGLPDPVADHDQRVRARRRRPARSDLHQGAAARAAAARHGAAAAPDAARRRREATTTPARCRTPERPRRRRIPGEGRRPARGGPGPGRPPGARHYETTSDAATKKADR